MARVGFVSNDFERNGGQKGEPDPCLDGFNGKLKGKCHGETFIWLPIKNGTLPFFVLKGHLSGNPLDVDT